MSRFIPIIIAGILLSLILGGIFLWWPNFQEFQALKLEFEKKEMQVKQKEEYFVKLNALAEKLTEYEDQLAKIDSALPEDLSIANLFYFVLNTSSENGLILERITADKGRGARAGTGAGAEAGGVKTTSFPITVLGSYSAFKHFLSAVYKNVRLIEVDNISFSSEVQETGLVDFTLGMSTHYYEPTKEAMLGAFPEGIPGEFLPPGAPPE